MSRLPLKSYRGSVILVVLCFVAVLGIGLAGYLAVSTQAMNLSNRSYHEKSTRQLAEIGIDEALRAFNRNLLSGTDTTAALADWSSGGVSSNWTLNTTNRRASATLTFPADKFGKGTTASVKIRVDNYDVAHGGAVWSSSKTYRINDLVGYSGNWYRSVRNGNLNQTPNESEAFLWWVPAPIPWAWDPNATYALHDLVNHKGVWFRCIRAIPSGTLGTEPSLPQQWVSGEAYALGETAVRSNELYRCIKVHNSSVLNRPANTEYWSETHYWMPLIPSQPWRASTSYSADDGDVVNYSGSQYRCISNHTSALSFDASKWSIQINPISLSWNSSAYYSRGSIVFLNGTWYYCRKAGISATSPASLTSKWVSLLAPSGSTPTAPAPAGATPDEVRYSVGDYIYRSGRWYRCIYNHVFDTWAAHSSYWTDDGGALYPYLSWAWRTGVAYPYNSAVYFAWWGGGTWYRSYANAVGWYPDPTQTSYWENALSGVVQGWNSNANYNLGDTIYHSGTTRWYRCIVANKGQAPSTTSAYWADTPPISSEWNSGKQYSQYDTVRYNGVWYLSLQNSNIAQIPSATSSAYWALAPQALSTWSSSKNYTENEVVSYSGAWYRCILSPPANQVPSNTTYWSVVTGAYGVAGALGAACQWNSSTSFAAGSYASYGGVWYKCLALHSNRTPNDSTYWTPSWANSFGVTTGAPVIYAEGTIAIAGNPSIKTQLRATIAPAPLFPNAAAATTELTVTTGTGTVDSYDSSVATYSAGTAGYSAVLAAGTTLAINGTTDVKGFVAWPSPAAGISTDTKVRGPNSSASPKVDPARVSRSPFIPLFDILPTGGLATAFSNNNFHKGLLLGTNPSGTVTIGTPGATVSSRYYYNADLQIGSAGTYAMATLKIVGPVILYVNGYLRTENGGIIDIIDTGSAEIHVSSFFRSYSLSHGILNRSQNPKKLILLTDSSLSSSSFFDNGNSGTNKDFHGVLYAPNITTSVGHEIKAGINIYGALSANEITFTSEANLHYDTSLRYATFGGVDQPYTVDQWRELPVTEQATMP